MPLPAVALAAPLMLEHRRITRRRGRPKALPKEIGRMVCEWMDAGVDADATWTALVHLGYSVSRATLFRLRGACLFEYSPLLFSCGECGARSPTGTCPNGHRINPNY